MYQAYSEANGQWPDFETAKAILMNLLSVGAAYGVLELVFGGSTWAEDLLGEVWVAAFESRRTYDQSFADARPWLYGVALNKLRRYWRSQPAEDLVSDVASLVSGWDPWPVVDARAIASSSAGSIPGLTSSRSRTLPSTSSEDTGLPARWSAISSQARSSSPRSGFRRRCRT